MKSVSQAMVPDYYELLDVDASASHDQIRVAYRHWLASSIRMPAATLGCFGYYARPSRRYPIPLRARPPVS